MLLESAGTGAVTSKAAPLEVADDPCFVLLSSTGLLARTTSAEPLPAPDPAARCGARRRGRLPCRATARGEVGAVTSAGPHDPAAGARHAGAAADVVRAVAVGRRAARPSSSRSRKGETVVTLSSLRADSAGLALGTAQGVVKRVATDYPLNKTEWEVVALRDGDSVVGAVELPHESCDLVFVTSDAQLLRFARRQGAAAGPRRGRDGRGQPGARCPGRALRRWST